MSWNLEGKYVVGTYLGEFAYSGLVTESRVKYGGTVQHTVKLGEPFTIHGETREYVLADSNEVSLVLDK